VLPAAMHEGGALYLGLPVAFTQRKTVELLRSFAWSHRLYPSYIAIDIPAGELSTRCATLEAAYTQVERDTIRAMFVAGNGEPQIGDFLDADSLTRVSARSRANLLVDTIEGHFASAFQPIVAASSLEIFGYEGLLRTTPGAPLTSPGDIFHIARNADLLPQTDLAARRTMIANAARAGIKQHLFVNFMPSSIYDPKSCLRQTIAAADGFGIPHDHIVFEVVESDEVEDPSYLLDILRSYRQAGFQVALDDLGSGFASLNLLHMLRPDFIKLDIALVHGIEADPFKAMLAAKIIEAAHELEMTVIAEGIETEAEYRWMRDNGAHLLQGFYLARPDAVPASVVTLPS
jgi:EAL domain-containing protein (putative c-di-GMP-specific phosphodiesterase class I)